MSCKAWRYYTCVAWEHGQLLVLHDTAKGVASETRSEPLPLLASLAVGSTPRANKKNMVTHTSGRQKCHLTMLAFLLYKQYNNNFIFTCTNQLEYHLLPEKGGVRINRGYELLEILRQIHNCLWSSTYGVALVQPGNKASYSRLSLHPFDLIILVTP